MAYSHSNNHYNPVHNPRPQIEKYEGIIGIFTHYNNRYRRYLVS